MKSKALIEKQLQRKTNPELVETIIACKKNNSWMNVGSLLSGSKRKRANVNLEKINKEAKEGETIIIPGKVLSDGQIDKKVNVVALGFSKDAKEKLLNSKCKVSSILEAIKSNPSGKGIKILK